MTTLAPIRTRRPDPAATIDALRSLLGDRLSTAAAVCLYASARAQRSSR